jgi:hypothetical protein
LSNGVNGTREIPPPRFTTLQALVRDWSRYRRISELQGLGWAGSAEEEGERLTRLWVSEDRRIREERDTGEVVQPNELQQAANWPLIDARWFADAPDLVYLGTREVAGREGAAFEAHTPAGFLLPGSNRCVGVFDAERGVLLRVKAWRGDELLMIEEMREVSFDSPLDTDLFASD